MANKQEGVYKMAIRSATAQKTLDVVNPYDLKPIGSVALADWPTVDQFLSDAHAVFDFFHLPGGTPNEALPAGEI